MYATVFGVAVLSIAPISVKWSPERTLPVLVAVDKAHAVVGRPATPASVAEFTEGVAEGRCDAVPEV